MGWFYEPPKHRPRKLTKREVKTIKSLPALIIYLFLLPIIIPVKILKFLFGRH